MSKHYPRAFFSLLCLFTLLFSNGFFLSSGFSVQANDTAQTIPFSQNWSNTSLITTNHDWSSVPGIVGYRGDALTGSTGTDPQTIVADGSVTPVDFTANQTDPNTFVSGGVNEYEITNPTVAFQGSGTADAPHIVINLNTSGTTAINVAYK